LDDAALASYVDAVKFIHLHTITKLIYIKINYCLCIKIDIYSLREK
jgi:hypothetical protein